MQLTKNILKWFEAHPARFVIVFVIYTVFIGGSGWVMPLVKDESINCNLDCSKPQTEGEGTENKDTAPVCRTEDFNSEKWETANYRRNKEGYWCPKGEWEDPVMWYPEGLRPGFASVYVEYQIQKDQSISTANPPSFITAYGKDIPIFKSWIPEGGNLQIFRFAKNLDLNRKILTAELALDLPDPAAPYKKDSFAIVQDKVLEGGEILLNFIYNYYSGITGEPKPKTFPKTVKMPGSDPASSLEKYPFGIGTFVGNCIKPTVIKICE